MIDAPHRRLRAVLRLYLTQQALYMNFDGRFRYVEVARNVLVGGAPPQMHQDLTLPRRQAYSRGRLGRWRHPLRRSRRRRQSRRSLLRGIGLRPEFDFAWRTAY